MANNRATKSGFAAEAQRKVKKKKICLIYIHMFCSMIHDLLRDHPLWNSA